MQAVFCTKSEKWLSWRHLTQETYNMFIFYIKRQISRVLTISHRMLKYVYKKLVFWNIRDKIMEFLKFMSLGSATGNQQVLPLLLPISETFISCIKILQNLQERKFYSSRYFVRLFTIILKFQNLHFWQCHISLAIQRVFWFYYIWKQVWKVVL
jgi:hypothetical protein